MARLRIWALLVALLAAVTTSVEGGPTVDIQDTSLSLRASAKEIAAELLEAMKRGDAQAFVQRLDLRALHDEAVKQEDETAEFAEFVESLEAKAEAAFGDEPADDFEYEITGSIVLVKVRVRHGEDGEWREHEIAFVEEDGGWRITPEGMRQFDFGYGRRGPIARRVPEAESAEAAAEAMLEGIREGDADVMLDHLDLKGLYEQAVREEMRAEMPYEQFRKILRENVERREAKEDFEYQVLGSKADGDATIVTVKTKEDKDAEWEEHEVPLKKIDGTWKITAEGLQKLNE